MSQLFEKYKDTHYFQNDSENIASWVAARLSCATSDLVAQPQYNGYYSLQVVVTAILRKEIFILVENAWNDLTNLLSGNSG